MPLTRRAERKQPATARRPARPLTFLGGVLITVVISACGSHSDYDGPDSDVAAPAASSGADDSPAIKGDDPPRFATWNREVGPDENGAVESLGALAEGRLVLDDGCVYLGESPEYRSLLVLPDDATWDEESLTIELDGKAATIGDLAALGGGEISQEGIDVVIADLPAGCDTSRAWQGFQFTETSADLYAEEFGVSKDEAEHRIQTQRTYEMLLEQVKTALPDRYAGELVDHEGDFALTIRFTGDEVPAEAKAIVARSRVSASLEAGARHSQRETSPVTEAVRLGLMDHPGFHGFYFDFPNDEYVLMWKGDAADEEDHDLVAELRASLPAGLPAEVLTVRVELERRPDPDWTFPHVGLWYP